MSETSKKIKNMAQQEETFKKIVSHCKEYGFVFPSSEIYDGLGNLLIILGQLVLNEHISAVTLL